MIPKNWQALKMAHRCKDGLHTLIVEHVDYGAKRWKWSVLNGSFIKIDGYAGSASVAISRVRGLAKRAGYDR